MGSKWSQGDDNKMRSIWPIKYNIHNFQLPAGEDNLV